MTNEQLAEELKGMKLTKSQMIVLDILRSSGRNGVTPKQLLDKVSFAPRTVRYALRKLLKKQLIRYAAVHLHALLRVNHIDVQR
jgi:Fe2+ or Zn2+ uptake regulation protein